MNKIHKGMNMIQKTKSISIWIFLVPFIAVNFSLIISTQFTELFIDGQALYSKYFPYFDGGASISRTVRYFPNYLIFKPAMFLTSFLLIKYWLYNKEVICYFNKDHKYLKKVIFFGVASAIALTIHSIFLGIKFDNDLYKLFRRVVMLSFIIFEIIAQAYLVAILYSLKDKLADHINPKVLKAKVLLVSLLIVVAIICVPIISWPGDQYKFLKHLLEWDYFLGVITFYLLTFLMWKKN